MADMLPGLNDEHTIWVPGRDFSMNLIGLELENKNSKVDQQVANIYTTCI